MNYQNIQLETKDGVGKIIINRPPVNVLNIAAIEEMIDALSKLKTDDSVKVVAITAAGNRAKYSPCNLLSGVESLWAASSVSSVKSTPICRKAASPVWSAARSISAVSAALPVLYK